MSFAFYLDPSNHDIRIENGRIRIVHGAAEVAQRIKVALWHYQGEYFLDVEDGTPWYEQILGNKNNADQVGLILRRRILGVPGVVRIEQFNLIFDPTGRDFSVSAKVIVDANGEQAITIEEDLAV